METQMRVDMRGATLLRGRFKTTSKDDVVFRLYNTLNTTASAVLVDGYLRKFVGFAGTKSGFKDSRLRLGGGIRFRAGTGQYEKLYVGPVVKKEFHVDHHGQKSSSCLKLAGRCEWDASNAKPQKPAATGHALLSHKKLRLTDRMDFKGTVGAIWTWNPRSSRPWNLMPVAQMRENNWAATLTYPAIKAGKLGKPNLTFSYDL